jgi:hypothetical protein
MATFDLFTMAAGGPPTPPPPRVKVGNPKVRLNDEDPQIQSMVAFMTTFMDTGGSLDFLPNNAAIERFFAFLKFLRAEWQGGRIACWPESLLPIDGTGDVLLSNDLIMAAAIADLNWGRPFDRDHLLAMSLQGVSNF